MKLNSGKSNASLSLVSSISLSLNTRLNINPSTAETIIDKAIELNTVGGVYGNQKPTEFLCLLLKLLQIQPEKEILVEYLQADEFKCVLLGSTAGIFFLIARYAQISASTSSYVCSYDLFCS